jgi:biopolymer transport protein ExbB/TolQ
MEHLGFLKPLMESGGDWVIYLLVMFSVVALAVIIERIIVVTRQFKYQESTLMGLTERLEAGANDTFLKGIRKDSILYRMSAELIAHANNGALSLERHLDSRLALERRTLEKRVIILGTLGNNAPFVGLLGTVLGVIRAFKDLGASAGQGPEVVMQGISQALVATAVGIFVALPCVASYNFIKKRIKDTMIDADRFGKQLIAILEAKHSREGR